MVILAVAVFCSANAGEWTKVHPANSVDPVTRMINSSSTTDIVKFNLNAYDFKRVNTPKGVALVISSPEASPMLSQGNPDMPKLVESLIIPNAGNSEIEVVYSDYIEINDVDVAPSKGIIYRNQDPEQVPYTYSDVYEQDEFFPQQRAKLNEPYIMRNVRGQAIEVYPFAYNPVQKVLRVYTDITVKVTYTTEAGVNELQNRNISSSSEFEKIYSKHFLNYSQSRYTPVAEGAPGRMLIISYADFMDEMAPFVAWKRQKGIETQIVDVASIGNAAAIKTYIANEYNTNGLNYVLLVGDAAQVPTDETGNDSDNKYACISGSDSYVELFMGRISAENGTQVTTQITKIMQYERDYAAGNAWLSNALCSASNEGTGGQGDDGESDEQHMANIATDLEGFGYTANHQNQDGGSNTGISAAVNAGVGIANYVGHGSNTTWVNTNYANSDVDALTNEDKYLFAFSVACVNGNFKNNTCFAEAWLRATNNGKPTGAVGFLASTINQSWQSPMDGQDEMNDILVESYSNNIKRTFGGISFNGIFHMIDEYGTDGANMADTWTLFGDPSMMVRTKDPVAMTITHPNVINVGSTTYSVNCNVNGALVSLTKEESGQTVIMGTGYVTGGVANVTLTAFTAPTTMKVTVTAFDKVTYQEDVNVIVPSGPYVTLNSVVVDDAAANNNAVLNNGETSMLDVTFENVGVADATGLNVVMSTSSSDLTISDANENYGTIAQSATGMVNDGFAVAVADGIADQTVIPVAFAITDGSSNTWNCNHSFTIAAPALALEYVSVSDAAGNNDGNIDAGEELVITFAAKNTGHNQAVAGNAVLTVANNGTVATGTQSVAVNDASGSINVQYTVTVNASATTGSQLPLSVTYTAGSYTATASVSLPIGLQIEDWESNNFSSYSWTNDATNPWTVATDQVYAGTHSAKSGTLTSSGGESTLTISLNVTTASELSFYKKVSCEGPSGSYYWDYLQFSIDGNEQGKWAGEINWSQETYNVATGNHTLTWKYIKDSYMDEGSDCAWIDNVVLPSHNSITAITQTTVDVEAFKFEISPNPASDFANISFDLVERENVKVDIVDIHGRVISNVYNQESPEGTYRVAHDISDLPNGMYIIRLVAGKNVTTEQLIISK